MSDLKDWSTTAASNNDPSPDGWPESTLAPSGVNNSAREMMAALRRFYDAIEWRDWGHTISYGSANSFTTAAGDGDTTGIYKTGRRVRVTGTLTGTVYGQVINQSHSTITTVTVVLDSGTIQNDGDLAVAVGWDDTGNPWEPVASTGDIRMTYRSTAVPGWINLATADWSGADSTLPSIGNENSNATIRAAEDTEDLFVLLWDTISGLAVQDSAGVPQTRGGTAAADYAADRRLVLPDDVGRSHVPSGTNTSGGSLTLGGFDGALTLTTGSVAVQSGSGTTAAPGGESLSIIPPRRHLALEIKL